MPETVVTSVQRLISNFTSGIAVIWTCQFLQTSLFRTLSYRVGISHSLFSTEISKNTKELLTKENWKSFSDIHFIIQSHPWTPVPFPTYLRSLFCTLHPPISVFVKTFCLHLTGSYTNTLTARLWSLPGDCKKAPRKLWIIPFFEKNGLQNIG